MELKLSSSKQGGLSPSDCISDPEEKEVSDDDDDDRNHKHRRRDTRSQSLERDALDQVITRPYRKRNKPFANGQSVRDNDSQASTPWKNYSSTPFAKDFPVNFDKRRPGSASLPRAPYDLNQRIRANQAFPGDLGPGRGRGRDSRSWIHHDSRLNSDIASQLIQQGSIPPNLFGGRGLPNVTNPQSASWNAFGLIPGVPNGRLDTLHPIGLQGTLRPPIRSLNMGISRQRCRDFEERGFCLRGDMCPMEHGVNRIVVEDVQSLSQFNLPGSLPSAHLLGKSTGPGSQPAVSASSTTLMNSKDLHSKTSRAGVADDASLGGADFYDPDQPLWNNNSPETSNALLGLHSSRNDETESLKNDDPADNEDNEFPIGIVGTAAGSQSTSMSVWGRIGSSKSRSDVKEKIDPIMDSSDYPEHETKETLVSIQNQQRQGKRHSTDDAGLRPISSLPKRQFDTMRNVRKPQKALRTLFVNGIPQKCNRRDALLSHFKRFGKVLDIYIPSNSERAFVQFSKREEAEAALTAPDAVMGNRFIKLWWANRDSIPEDGTANASTVSETPHDLTSVSVPPHIPVSSFSKDNHPSTPSKGSIVHVSDASLPTSDTSIPAISNGLTTPPLQKKLDTLEQLKEELRKKQEMLDQKRNDFRRQLDKLEKQAGPKGEADTELAAKRRKMGMTADAGKVASPCSSSAAPISSLHDEMLTDANKSGDTIVSHSPKTSTTPVLQQSSSLKQQSVRPLAPLVSPVPLNKYKLDNRPTGFRILPPLPSGFANVAVMKEHFAPYGDISDAELEDLESHDSSSDLQAPKDYSARISFATRRSAEKAFLNGKCWEGCDLKFMWLASSIPSSDRSGEKSPSTTPKGLPLVAKVQPADKLACAVSQDTTASGDTEPEHSERKSGVEHMEMGESSQPCSSPASREHKSSNGDVN